MTWYMPRSPVGLDPEGSRPTRPGPRPGAARRASILAAGMALAGLLLLAAAAEGLARPIDVDPASSNGPTSPNSPAQSIPPATLPERYILATTWQSPPPYPKLHHPEGLDVADDGLILVAERGNHRISVYGLNSGLKGQLGSLGSDDGQLRAPEDVAIVPGGDRIYVADTGNRRVAVLERYWAGFDLGLRWVDAWPDAGLPRGIAADRQGRVYVSDAEGHQILVFDADGNRLDSWGGYGRLPGRLDTPLGLSVEPGGRLHIADSGNQRINTWDLQGQPLSTLRLDNSGQPGGVPYDVGVDERGDMYVAVERGLLRYRANTGFAETLPALRLVEREGCSCYQCGGNTSPQCCPAEYDAVPAQHEGTRRVAVHLEHGIFSSYASELRFDDRIVARPRRGFETVFPASACELGPPWRNVFDPIRIDTSMDPSAARVLDSSGLLRLYRENGAWYDGRNRFRGGPGVDVAGGFSEVEVTRVLTGNEVQATSHRCFLGCPPGRSLVLDDRQLQRRNDRTGDLEPDFRWWLTALAVEGNQAVLDGGLQRVILRQTGGQPCNVGCDLSIPPLGEQQLIAAVSLNGANSPFRAFRDLAYDTRGNLRVLAADGEVLGFDARGRDIDPVRLEGLRNRPLEALGASLDENGVTLFTLSADGWAFKHDTSGRMLAAWDLAAEAGPGRYRDLSVDSLGRVLIPDGDADRILVFERQPDQPGPPPPDPRGDACQVQPDKQAEPIRLALGETTEVQLSLSASCGPAWDALDIVLAVDQSCQMGGERLAAARAAGNALIDAMRIEADRLALVGYNDEPDGARLLVPLTDDVQQLRDALSTLSTECLPPMFYPERRYDGRTSAGLRAGGEALFGPAARPEAGKVLVLATGSTIDREQIERIHGRSLPGTVAAPVTDRQHSMWEAWRLWERGVRIFTAGLGVPSQRLGVPAPPAPDLQSSQPPDEGLLSALANPPTWYRKAEAPADLEGIATEIGGILSDRSLLQSLVITDRVPINMRLLAASVRPPATILPNPDPASSALIRWDLAPVPLGAAPPVLSYQLEPLETGRHPTNVDAAAVYTDGLDYPGRVLFPVPEVEVIGPTQTPPPSPSPEASATPLPGITPSPSPSPTLLPTATPRPTGIPIPLYLPILYREQCVPKAQPVDVALVIDTSSSMAGAKLDAAREAARNFIDLLEPTRDRAAVVGFDSDARLAQALTSDRAALDRALSSLAPAVGTRIDLGLWTALGELTGANRRPTADRVIVLLTDGRPQLGTEPAMRTAAQLARDVGVATHVIGLGSDVLPGVLRDIAGTEERVYLAPDEAALAAIYREIARLIPCR